MNGERVRERCRTMLEEMAERRNTTVDGDIWVHDERMTIEKTDEWGAAVAAMLYTL